MTASSLSLHTRYNGDMSLAIAIKVPEGLVLAAESRVSYQIPDGTGNSNFITFDNATKLLSFQGHDYVGAVTFGAGNIGTRTAHSFIPEFLSQLGKQRLAIDAFAQKMSDFYMAQWNEAMPDVASYKGQDMVFVVGGFNDKSPYGTIVQFALPRNPKPVVAISNDEFNMVWGGDRTIVDRIFSGIDGRLDAYVRNIAKKDKIKEYDENRSKVELPITITALALQDAVNLAITLIKSTIELQSLSTGQRTVGGPIDVAIITREGNLSFIQKKKISGEKNNGHGTYDIPANPSLLASLTVKDWRLKSYMSESPKGKKLFKKLIKSASQPVLKEQAKSAQPEDYNEKQTRSRKTEDTSAKPRGKSRQSNASSETKSPR